jgi:hypothetical protein
VHPKDAGMRRLHAMSEVQRNSHQPVCLICHEKRNIQNVSVQSQIVQGEPDTQFHLIAEQFLGFFQASAVAVGGGFDFHREDVILPLNQEIIVNYLSPKDSIFVCCMV